MATSTAAQLALADASRILRATSSDPTEVERVDADLHRLLPEMDPFLIRWQFYREHSGEKPA